MLFPPVSQTWVLSEATYRYVILIIYATYFRCPSFSFLLCWQMYDCSKCGTAFNFIQTWNNDRRTHDVGGKKAQLYRSTKVRHTNATIYSRICCVIFHIQFAVSTTQIYWSTDFFLFSVERRRTLDRSSKLFYAFNSLFKCALMQ